MPVSLCMCRCIRVCVWGGFLFLFSLFQDVFLRIIREEGIAALWSGTVPSLLLVSNPVIQFVAYEQSKWLWHRLFKSGGAAPALTTVEYFLLAAVAKAVATVATYPLQVAQSRLRAASRVKDSQEASRISQRGVFGATFGCLRELVHDNGYRALFRGIESKLLQTVLTAAFTFATYEKILVALKAIARPNLR